MADLVPRPAAFLLILIIGLILAKAIEEVLEKVGFDGAVERGGVKKALATSQLDASDIVAKLVHHTLVLFVLQFAFGANPISDLLAAVIAFNPKLIVATVIIVVAAAIAAGAKTPIEGTLGGLSYGKLLAITASIVILGPGTIAALEQVGVATAVATPVLVAVLATTGGILVIGVGGRLIGPTSKRWEGYLAQAEAEARGSSSTSRTPRASRPRPRRPRTASSSPGARPRPPAARPVAPDLPPDASRIRRPTPRTTST